MNDVQPYALGGGTAPPAARLAGLEKLGDRLARRLRAIIEPYGGCRPAVTARPIEDSLFMMWDASVPAFVSLSLYRLHPIKGTVALRIDADLVSLLVDRFYGGHGPRIVAARREFTPTEHRLVGRLSGQIVAALAECWAEIASVEPMLLARETNVGRAEVMAGEAEVVVQGFDINLGEKDGRLIEIVYPKAGFAGLDSAAGGSDAGAIQRAELLPPDPAWQAGLAARLDDVRLPARTVLARPNLKMSELLALQPGDVIPIHIARHLPLLVGERVFAHGTVGEQDGSVAFMIEKLA
ncbi:MAG TPA: FliM/FliN family flagellar motor switch protein [Sphingobium sp.]|nr:FliM/FliN family flagellar motor switch protein [Sphingobium sp.]